MVAERGSQRFLAYGINYLEFGESSVWGKISTVNRRDPQCGGKFLQ